MNYRLEFESGTNNANETSTAEGDANRGFWKFN